MCRLQLGMKCSLESLCRLTQSMGRPMLWVLGWQTDPKIISLLLSFLLIGSVKKKVVFNRPSHSNHQYAVPRTRLVSYMDLYSFVTISIALSVWKIFYALFLLNIG